jgi:hypothetical protein
MQQSVEIPSSELKELDWGANFKEDRYMLDYWHGGEVRWVRSPFVTWNQVVRMLGSLQNEQFSHRLTNFSKPDENFVDLDWELVRIHSERELDVMVDEDGKAEDLVPMDEKDKFVPVCTKREYLFGTLYQNIADQFRSGKKVPDDLNYRNGWSKMPLVDRDDVIEELRDTYPDGIDWELYDEGDA